MEETYKQTISSSLDIDNLTYHYQFVDQKVSRVVGIYEKTELKSKDQVYLLQAASRGEVDSEEKRFELKNLLGQ